MQPSKRGSVLGYDTRAACPPRSVPKNYQQAHDALRRLRGRAVHYACADCGKQARDWSYEGGHASPQWYISDTGRMRPWSIDARDYLPRCRSCHVLKDQAHWKGVRRGGR